MTALDRIIAVDPADLVSRHERANCLMTFQRLTQAINDFKYIAAVNPTAESLLELSRAEWSAGQTVSAIADLRKAGSLTTDGPLLFTIASTQRADGDLAAALATLLNVPAPNRDFRWYIELGKIDAVKADPSLADHDFSKALAIAPGEARGSVFAAWGDARWFQGRYEGALDRYVQAVGNATGIDPLHIYAQMADCHTKLGKLADAVSDYRSGLAGGPTEDVWEALSLGLATTLIKLHRTAEASEVLHNIVSNPRISSDTRRQAQAMQVLISK